MDQGNNAVIAYANIIISDGTLPPVEPTLEIEDPGQTVTVGYQFKPILRPPVAGETFTWTISSNVATLDATGKVTHTTTGSATITGLKATKRVNFKTEIDDDENLGVPYAYNGYYFDGPRANGNAFYDPMAVIYSNAGVITRHPATF